MKRRHLTGLLGGLVLMSAWPAGSARAQAPLPSALPDWLLEAARRMDMSYNRAWLHVKTMNEGFAEPLVASSRGGNAKGGATLTSTGTKVLALYRELVKESVKATRTTWAKLSPLLKEPG